VRVARLLAFSALILTSCVSARIQRLSPVVYPPISAEQVTVFMDPGELRADSIRYDRVALIFTSGSSKMTSSDQHVRKAREEAAKLGANGVVIQTYDPGGRHNWFWRTSSNRESSVMAIRWSTVPVAPVRQPAEVSTAQTDIAAVVLEPAVDTLRIGGQRQLIATARSSSGMAVEGRLFRWASSNDSIASVSTYGLVTARAAGSVRVSAMADGLTGTASIVVLAPR